MSRHMEQAASQQNQIAELAVALKAAEDSIAQREAERAALQEAQEKLIQELEAQMASLREQVDSCLHEMAVGDFPLLAGILGVFPSRLAIFWGMG